MAAFRFNHLGVAVPGIDAAVDFYTELFGYKLLAGPFEDASQQAKVAFIGSDREADFVIELIAPLSETSHVAGILAKGIGAYHICYEVDDIEHTLDEVRARGCVIVQEPVPAVAYQGRRIAWFYTPAKQLMELVERER